MEKLITSYLLYTIACFMISEMNRPVTKTELPVSRANYRTKPFSYARPVCLSNFVQNCCYQGHEVLKTKRRQDAFETSSKIHFARKGWCIMF